ncbi:MAG: RNA 2',3'-cyclic phosphodiesterase [Ignavibacteria bacterium]
MAEPARRLFFALWPEADVAGRLHEAGKALQRACGGRVMRRDTLHVTLVFLGAVPQSRVADAEAAADRVAGSRFALELDGLACWKHNRIAWAGCGETPAALDALATQLAQRLREAGFRLDARPFAVHATLVRNADCAAPLPPLSEPIVWLVADFVLVESHTGPAGSRYEIVRRWALH